MSGKNINQAPSLGSQEGEPDTDWTALIVRSLMPGKMSYSDIQQSLPTINNKDLKVQLVFLEEHCFITKDTASTEPSLVQYELTDLGKKLELVLATIANFNDGEKE